MDLNIRIHVTPGTARRLIYVGVTLLLGVAATTAYAVPNTFVSGQTLTAAQLNQNFTDLDSRLGAIEDSLARKVEGSGVPIVTEWTAYSPHVTTKEGLLVEHQSTSGMYRRVGDSLQVHVETKFDAPPETGSVWWQWSLPRGMAADETKLGLPGAATIGVGSLREGSNNFVLAVYVRSSSGVSASAGGVATPYINDTTPVAFQASSEIALEFTIPIQGWTATE